MATAADTNSPLQNSQVPQGNDESLQPQEAGNSTQPQSETNPQTTPTDINSIRQQTLQVKSGPPAPFNKKASTLGLTIGIVSAILIIAAALFVASLRVPDDKKAKPTVAVGPEEHGAVGEKLSKRQLKKQKKLNKTKKK